MSFVLSPRRSGALVAASEVVNLEDLKVKRATMMRDGEHWFPTYTLHDKSTGRVLEFSEHVSGGKLDDPAGACVAAYKDPSSGAVVMVKTLCHNDTTNETALVRWLSREGCLEGIMVEAHVGREARARLAPRAGAALTPLHYGVVLMHYAGQPLTTLNMGGAPQKAAFVTRGVAAACAKLLACGLAHVDLKPANVLYSGLDYDSLRLTLCDYGGLAPLGSGHGMATYPPPEHPFGTHVHAGERVMVYQLGVLLVCLFTDHLEKHLRYRKPCDAARQGVASLKLGLACNKVLRALYVQDTTIAALVQLAWQPQTTIQQLIYALDYAVSGPAAPDAAVAAAAAAGAAPCVEHDVNS